jgi:hypothetical protein
MQVCNIELKCLAGLTSQSQIIQDGHLAYDVFGYCRISRYICIVIWILSEM